MDKTREEVRREFARRLQEKLNERGWNQSDLARRLFGQTNTGGAKGRDNVSGWVRALSLPVPHHLKMICDALGTERDELLPGGLQKAETARPAPFKITAAGGSTARLEIDQEVPMDTALKVIDLLRKAQE